MIGLKIGHYLSTEMTPQCPGRSLLGPWLFLELCTGPPRWATKGWCGSIAGVKAFQLAGQAVAADGTVIKLMRRGEEYSILADGAVLMSSRMHGSEDVLAKLGCEGLRRVKRACVLIGGLGMGFTLRAALDLLAADATAMVAELVPAVVEWNRGELGHLAGHPLEDRRVQVEMGDVAGTLRLRAGQFDAVMLDVDNGPAAMTASNNAGLYDERGVAVMYAALRAKGVLAIWAIKEDRKFEKRLRAAGFEVRVERVKKSGVRHTIFLGRKT